MYLKVYAYRSLTLLFRTSPILILIRDEYKYCNKIAKNIENDLIKINDCVLVSRQNLYVVFSSS